MQLTNQLLPNGYRRTWQRTAILKTMADIGGHMSVEQIFRYLQSLGSSIDLATVYRTVGLLSRLHLVSHVAGPDGRTFYELVDPFQPTTHMVCEHCGSAVHIRSSHLAGLCSAVVSETGFEIHTENLAISGLCVSCRSDKSHSHNGRAHHHRHGYSDHKHSQRRTGTGNQQL